MTPELASHLARIALGHVTREFPGKQDHVLTRAEDVQPPRALHPAFYGSFDWHSCVHGFWLLARLRRRPDFPEAAAIAALFDARLAPGPIRGELDYLARPGTGGFERPYGWAWLLMLAAEIARQRRTAPGRHWWAALQPLAAAFAQRLVDFLPRATYPVRAGTHGNTAFALALALEYAAVTGDRELGEALRAKAIGWYGADRDCPAWEPDGEDFLSPALIEAECMRRALAPAAFQAWFAGFLPRLGRTEPACLFGPVLVSDRRDGRIAQLDGLNLSRAWCWRSLAAALPAGAPAVAPMRAAAEAHLAAALPHVAGDYAGEHWLATYALLALDV